MKGSLARARLSRTKERVWHARGTTVKGSLALQKMSPGNIARNVVSLTRLSPSARESGTRETK